MGLSACLCLRRMRTSTLTVRVISKRRLRAFWERHAGTEASLAQWHQVLSQGHWHNFAELRSTFASADQVRRLTVFNVKGNDLRVIGRIDYNKQILWVRRVCTHAEYNKNEWKEDPWA